MKKNLLTKIVALSLAVVTALTPVSVSAAEKKVVTKDEYKASRHEIAVKYEDWDESDETYEAIHAEELALVKSLNGCYQENGAKIYTVLNDGKKTFKKTGKYSIIVGGKSALKDDGTVFFKAPKTGTYKFTFVTKTNVIGGGINIHALAPRNAKYDGTYKCNVTYTKNDKSYKLNTANILVTDKGIVGQYQTGGLGDYCDSYVSKMQKVTATVKLAKGEKMEFYMRSQSASMDEDPECAYNFVGVDMTVSKIK